MIKWALLFKDLSEAASPKRCFSHAVLLPLTSSVSGAASLERSEMSQSLSFIHEFVPGSAKGTLLLLHGTGGNEHDLIPLGHSIDPEANLISPRGKVLENGMPRFFRRFAEGLFDIEDLKKRTSELADFVVEAARHYGFDPDKIVGFGYSNGANIAASLLLLRPGILRAAILFRPMVPLVPEPLPDLAGVQILIAAGNQDPYVPVPETERLVALLRSAGADLTVCRSNVGHRFTSDEVETAKCWVKQLQN
jgi:predicted esterase